MRTKVPVNYPPWRRAPQRKDAAPLWALIIQMVLTRRCLIDWRTLSSTSAKLITGYLTTNLSRRLIKKRLSAAPRKEQAGKILSPIE